MIYDWMVIGAGPAGIIALGALLDHGIKPQQIIWVDPEFKVGDFGTTWCNIHSNTKVRVFLKTLHRINSFLYHKCSHGFAINNLDSDSTCLLRYMAEPLQWITDNFVKTVSTIKGYAKQLTLKERLWSIQFENYALQSKNVILATGSIPKKLSYLSSAVIQLENAMVSNKLINHINANDTIAVFGSSHSAVLVLKNLVEHNVKRIINFYREQIFYAVFYEDYPLFGNDGLIGPAAAFAREHIDGTLPPNLERVFSSDDNIKHYIPQCNKVIYAIGFERRKFPIIDGVLNMKYVEHCGIIAPGLFGLGIAFPQTIYNQFGIMERRVGIWKFTEYLQRVMPIWLNYST